MSAAMTRATIGNRVLQNFAKWLLEAALVATFLGSGTVVAQPKPVSVNPSKILFYAGQTATFTVNLSPIPTTKGVLSAASSNTKVFTVPSSVGFAAGQAAVAVTVSAVAPGAAFATFSANGGQITPSVTVNSPPTVSITSPSNNVVFAAPANITVAANAADSDGAVSQVEFFDGATLVGTDTTAPYSVALANVAPGTHIYTARATDNNGGVTTSSAVTVIVNAAPTVSITAPANNAVFASPATISVMATAADSDGTVTKVDFFDGATLVGTSSTAPYSVTLSNVPGGSHAFTARVTDNRGATTASDIVNVIVDAPPTISIVSPTNNAVVSPNVTVTITANATDADGTISKVEFLDGTTLISTATAAPYTATLTNLSLGAHTLTARATDDRGVATTSATVTVNVDMPPSVNLTAPANNAAFVPPASITLAATASDSDGTIASVAFYYGTTLITTRTAPPYTFTWTGVPAGNYVLTAVTTDNLGISVTSSSVSVTVSEEVGRGYFIHVDHLNTPRLVTDATGNAVWKWDQQEPFGSNPADENPSGLGGFDLPLRLPGQYFDKETNLHHNYFRDYDPDIGRYSRSDPIGIAGGLNVFSYALSNPLRYVDVLGLAPGDLFASPDDAAIDAARYARSQIPRDIEYGGWIYQVKECFSYNYTRGTRTNIPWARLEAMRPAKPAGLWHTHPDTGNPSYDNSFSYDGGDADTARREHLPVYLNTPHGDNKVFDPTTGNERIVSTPMRPKEPACCQR